MKYREEGKDRMLSRARRCTLFYFLNFFLMKSKKTSNENERNVSPSHHSLAFVLHNERF